MINGSAGLQSIRMKAHLQDIPGAQVVLQDLDLVVRLLLQLGAKLLERLELVDELIDDLPEPLVGKVQDDWLLWTQEAVEEVAVVVIRLEPEHGKKFEKICRYD